MKFTSTLVIRSPEQQSITIIYSEYCVEAVVVCALGWCRFVCCLRISSSFCFSILRQGPTCRPFCSVENSNAFGHNSVETESTQRRSRCCRSAFHCVFMLGKYLYLCIYSRARAQPTNIEHIHLKCIYVSVFSNIKVCTSGCRIWISNRRHTIWKKHAHTRTNSNIDNGEGCSALIRDRMIPGARILLNDGHSDGRTPPRTGCDASGMDVCTFYRKYR